jgi:hypothetical protein
MAAQTASALAPSPLVELELDLAAFAADWNHCDQIANYLAQLVSHDRPDTFLYANLLSTVLNELLEVVYARHQPAGAVKCTLRRTGPTDHLEFRIPVDQEARGFYLRSVHAAESPAVAERYTRALLGSDAPDRALGFLELAADYGARFSIEEVAGETEIRLTVQVTLEDGGTPALTEASL